MRTELTCALILFVVPLFAVVTLALSLLSSSTNAADPIIAGSVW